MTGASGSTVIESRRRLIQWSAAGVLLAVSLALVFHGLREKKRAAATVDRYFRAKVKHVRSGHKVKLKSGDTLVYAGIRAPYRGEELYEEARRRNAELVEEKKVRLRFDKEKRDAKTGYLTAYAFADGLFVNETLVREGLAYVRLTPKTRRFAKELLAAQSAARRRRLGLWRRVKRSPASRYPADPKYGNFHRPDCDEVPRIDPARLVVFDNKREAFNKGFAPCAKCRP